MWMKNKTQQETSVRDFDINELIAAEEELRDLKQQYGIEEKVPLRRSIIDRFFANKESRTPVAISKKKYCLTALFGGWLGIHCFMVGKKGQGILYLVTCFTGISFAMSIMDILYAAFLETDDSRLIRI